jgi:hypothetical protein
MHAGMSAALGIMAIEWALFLVLAWYLEQVLPSGAPPEMTILNFIPIIERFSSYYDIHVTLPALACGACCPCNLIGWI